MIVSWQKHMKDSVHFFYYSKNLCRGEIMTQNRLNLIYILNKNLEKLILVIIYSCISIPCLRSQESRLFTLLFIFEMRVWGFPLWVWHNWGRALLLKAFKLLPVCFCNTYNRQGLWQLDFAVGRDGLVEEKSSYIVSSLSSTSLRPYLSECPGIIAFHSCQPMCASVLLDFSKQT